MATVNHNPANGALPNHLEPTLASSASLALLHGVPHVCAGCRNVIDQDGGGTVVMFGTVYFHQECFQCARCGDHVPPDVKALLFVDGAPICEKCSYSCSVCKKPIMDEVIMTGEDTYHAACFCCKQCSRRIDELVFAKTTQGVYCMDCHNERVARSRRHLEQKRTKSKGPRKEKERPKETNMKEPGTHSPQGTPRNTEFSYPSLPNTPNTPSTVSMSPSPMPRTQGYPSHAKRLSTQAVLNPVLPKSLPSSQTPSRHPPPLNFSNQSNLNNHSYPSTSSPIREKAPSPTREHPPLPPAKDPPPMSANGKPSSGLPTPRGPRERVDTLPLPSTSEPQDDRKKRKSYDDGVRPLHLLFNGSNGQEPNSRPTPQSQSSLDVPNRAPLAERRRSISPAPLLSPGGKLSNGPASSKSEGRLSPQPSSPLRAIHEANSPDSMNASTYYSPAPSPLDLRLLDKPSSSQPSSRATSPSDPNISSSAPTKSAIAPPVTQSRAATVPTAVNNPPPRSDSLPAKAQSEAGSESSWSFEDVYGTQDMTIARLGSPTPTPSKAEFPEDVLDSDESSARPSKEGKGSLDLERSQTPQSSTRGRSSDEQRGEKDRSSEHTQLPVPALPPMRFSMNESDFADFINNVASSPPKSKARAKQPDPLNRSDSSSSAQSQSQPTSKHKDPPQQRPQSESKSEAQPQPRSESPDTDSPAQSGQDDTISMNPNRGVNPVTGLPTSGPPANGLPPVATSIIIHDTGDSSMDSASPTSATGERPGLTADASDSSRLASENSRLLLGGSYSSLANSSSTSLGSRSGTSRQDTLELISRRLRGALEDTSNVNVKLDREFVEAIARAIDGTREKYSDLKGEVDKVKRTSQQYMTGMSVAQEEYHKEIAGRRVAEAEVTRLRVQLSGQAVQLSAMAAEDRRREVLERLMRELTSSLHGLEMEVAKLKVEKDMAVAEMDELSRKNSPTGVQDSPSGMIRSFTLRLDNIKTHYKKDLEPLKLAQETLHREIAELKEARDIFLEETTALNARNEELAELNAQIVRQIEGTILDASPLPEAMENGQPKHGHAHKGSSFNVFTPTKKQSSPQYAPSVNSVLTNHTDENKSEESARSNLKMMAKPGDLSDHQPAKKFKWFGAGSGNKNLPNLPHKGTREHNFVQQNVLRIGRCDHCGDKMWGTLWRCSYCHTSCHPRCLGQIQLSCLQVQQPPPQEKEQVLDIATLPPTMFGRALIEQVQADAKGTDRAVPIIVGKCIGAVEALALDYEGIYRKTGGTSQSKAITQLFERGNYDAFDLEDTDVFNDISSVTSVLKTYFRSLPDPLFTFALHEQFVAAAGLRDQREKSNALSQLISKLPREHYHTLRLLMLHLHRVMQRSDENLMNARNLGVVFGPTLMRSQDPGREFADMAGKALSVEWLVENAPSVFTESHS